VNLTLAEIAKIIKGTVIGKPTKVVSGFSSLYKASPDEISFLNKEISIEDISKIDAGAIICAHYQDTSKLNNLNLILVDNPKLSFSRLIRHIKDDTVEKGVHSSVIIKGEVKIDEDAYVGPNCILGDNVVIGTGCYLQGNVYINDNVYISENVNIGAGTVIGNEGFGYVKNENGNYEKVAHIGKVVIESNVDIGSNVVIDRGMLDETIVGKNSKINNLAHIGHNVIIKKNCLIKAGSIICGSSTIGSNVIIGPGAVINSHVKIGENAFVAMGAVVVKNVEPNSLVMGVPAKSKR